MKLSVLLLSALLWSITRTQFNLYNTDETLDIDSFQTNCLHYYNKYEEIITEKIEYCLGPADDDNLSFEKFPNTSTGKFTFDELRQLNATTKELLAWSASIDLAERYQYYIDQNDGSSAPKEIFFNCTKPWFGPRCQYSFGLGETYLFQTIIQKTFEIKFHSDSPYMITNLTCYIHLKCDRGGSNMCLDWREVCDGRIDCIDGGADEDQCVDLEINECDENEYRCHNGLCISNEFLKDGRSQCLDMSDMSGVFDYPVATSYPHIFDYEEHSCRPGDKQFKCGDGRCVADFEQCLNKRHLFLYESVSIQGNLSYTCWMAMVCLTKILDQVNGTSCQQFFRSSNISTYLQTCEVITQFPTVPVLFGHVRFLYLLNDTHDLDTDLALIPDYICYDQELCEFLTPMFRNGTYTCRQSSEIGFNPSMKLKTWPAIVRLVEPYFRKCLTGHNTKNDSHHSSVYCCKNSSKCISQHRILDSISDCYLNDDEEEFERSCLIDDVLRFKCGNENKCYSGLFSREICPPRRLYNLDEIGFQQICDRHVHMFPIIVDGENHTDETECKNWPCSNIYTRCDGFWSCPYGEDERNCTTREICSSSSLACVSPYNYTLICLSADRVSDGRIDCLGAADELQHCRSDTSYYSSYYGFRCWNDSKCVGKNDLCNIIHDCPFEDDEAFCEDRFESCSKCDRLSCTDMEEALCRIAVLDRIKFSLETSPIYPLPRSKTIVRMAPQPIEWRVISNYITNEPNDHTWPWRCNHGLYVSVWSGDNSSRYRCFCPPNYYGDLCQYQNQRVSFTAKVSVIDRNGIYAIIIILINDDDDRQEINSYHQFISVNAQQCERVYNTYLTYLSRPKNSSTNYSVRIDAFDKTSLTYLASWHFSISFPFLPDNRMAVVLNVPAHRVSNLNRCPLACHNGECMKYINKEKFFCRCFTGWSGARCDIPVRCSDCSSDSICIGMIHNRSICVCPVHKGGPRCLLTLSCPENFCKNKGQCLVSDDSMNGTGFVCVCPEQFIGPLCNIPNPKLEISFHNIKVSSSYLLIYLFTDTRNNMYFEQMTSFVIPQKLTMFQRTVSLYTMEPFRMVFVKIDDNYYLAVLQRFTQINLSTSIGPAQRCASTNEVLNSALVGLPKIRRMKFYHAICQTHLHLICFSDDSYMCLCTLERHANCMKFNYTPPICQHTTYCQNGAQCLNAGHICSLGIMCNCTDCFFGDRCQFYAKGIGLTLDDILRYDIRPNATIYDQTTLLKWSLAFTMIMVVAGLINSVLSILTFRAHESREVGCGMYLLALSITSLLTVSIFTLKFWFVVLTQINPLISRSVLRGGCASLEFILKVCLYTDNWLNACVAVERAVTVYKGVCFNKSFSKRIARWIITFLPLFIMVSIIHEPLYRDLFDDKDEQRLWCVLQYSRSLRIYNTIILLFHFFGPFCANLFSALFIIFRGARQRALSQTRLTYREHLWQQFSKHKHLIISSIILVVLSIPRLIISFLSGCVKVSRNSLLYIAGYFVSFVPSVTVFVVFVLPSDFYRKQFNKSRTTWYRGIYQR